MSVESCQAGLITLTWNAPTTNSDGSSITYFNGNYRVYSGTKSGSYTQMASLTSSGSVVSYQNANLTDGQLYYFVVTAVNTLGNESAYSAEITKTAQPTSPTTYTITASAGANGTITPSGVTTVNSGATQGYTITPASGYHVASVLVDGVSAGAVTSYNFSNVTANHTITATFAINTYTITASAGANGTITPSGVITVNSGATQGYTITPASGYHVASVLVDGVSAGAVTSYSFSNVTKNHTIGASFVVDAYVATDRQVCASGCQYSTIQQAIDESGAGDTIKVAQGQYNENIVIDVSKDFSLSGGWNSGFTAQNNNPYLTVINGDITGDGSGDGSVISVTAGNGVTVTCAISNMEITRGNALYGGGISAAATGTGTIELEIAGVVLMNNRAEYGGGISAGSTGGGSISMVVVDTMIVDNSATYGGAIDAFASGPGSAADITLINDTLTGNSSAYGGSIYAESQDSGSAVVSAGNGIIGVVSSFMSKFL